MADPSDSASAELARLAAHDDSAWEEFITAEYGFVFWFPAKVGRNPLGRDWDIATLGEWFGWVCERLRVSIGSYDGRRDASFRTFFSKILLNRFRDWLDHVRVRQRRAWAEVDLDALPEESARAAGDDPSEQLTAAQRLDGILQTIQSLSWLARMSLLLPNFLDKISSHDLEELARLHGVTTEALGRNDPGSLARS